MILQSICWYLACSLSYRAVEELMQERGFSSTLIDSRQFVVLKEPSIPKRCRVSIRRPSSLCCHQLLPRVLQRGLIPGHQPTGETGSRPIRFLGPVPQIPACVCRQLSYCPRPQPSSFPQIASHQETWLRYSMGACPGLEEPATASHWLG